MQIPHQTTSDLNKLCTKYWYRNRTISCRVRENLLLQKNATAATFENSFQASVTCCLAHVLPLGHTSYEKMGQFAIKLPFAIFRDKKENKYANVYRSISVAFKEGMRMHRQELVIFLPSKQSPIPALLNSSGTSSHSLGLSLLAGVTLSQLSSSWLLFRFRLALRFWGHT